MVRTLAIACMVVLLVGACTSEDASEPDPTYSSVPEEPEGSAAIAFASDRDGNFEIYVMNEDGSGQTRVTDDPGRDVDPSWSPDGESLVFVRDGDLHVIELSSGEERRLTQGLEEEAAPAWSPDGKSIAFQRIDGEGSHIALIDASGGRPKVFDDPDSYDASPEWSPDSKEIVFVGAVKNHAEIYAMSANGTDRRQITDIGEGQVLAPDWHPDGGRIAFTYISEPGNIDILETDAAGTGKVEFLTRNGASAPSWSVDGLRFAFERSLNAPGDIFVGRTGSPEQEQLTDDPSDDRSPDWSPAA